MIKKNFKIALFNERMLQGHGVDVVVDLMANGLAEAGYEVTVYALFTDHTFKHRRYDLKILGQLPKTLLERAVGKFISDMAARDLSVLFNKNVFRSIDADLFILNSYPFFSILAFTKTPCLVIDYGVASSRYLALRHKVNRWYALVSQRLFFVKAERIITISNFLQKLLPNYLKRKSQTIYLGADSYASYEVSAEKTKIFRNEIGLTDDDFLMLYVGRVDLEMRTYKDLQELLQIYKLVRSKNPKIKLMVVGYGVEEDAKTLKQEGVIPLLNLPKEKMALVYSACDLYATATKWEGFDLPLAEAQFFGKPVVAYNIGPHPELCKNGKSGFLVNSKEEFVRRIIEIANDPSLYKTLSAGAKIQSERFAWKRTVAECLAAVEKVFLEVGIK